MFCLCTAQDTWTMEIRIIEFTASSNVYEIQYALGAKSLIKNFKLVKVPCFRFSLSVLVIVLNDKYNPEESESSHCHTCITQASPAPVQTHTHTRT